MRVSTFPTLFGDCAVVRFFAAVGNTGRLLADLGFHDDLLPAVEELLGEMVARGPRFRTGGQRQDNDRLRLPSRAAPRAVARRGASFRWKTRSKWPCRGVAQSQVNVVAGLDLATGPAVPPMWQDPEVIMVGEIRDRATAEAAMQASLTGHFGSWKHLPRRQRRGDPRPAA